MRKTSKHPSPNLKKDRNERSEIYSQRQIKTERKGLTHFAVYSAISCLLCQNEKSVVHAWSHLWGCEFIKSIYQKINDCTEINDFQWDGCLYRTWALSMCYIKEHLASLMTILLDLRWLWKINVIQNNVWNIQMPFYNLLLSFYK